MILLYIYATLVVVFSLSILLKQPLTGSKADYEYLVSYENTKDSPMFYRIGVAVFGGLFWWLTLYFRFQDLLDAEQAYWNDH